jgi:transposase InsO family protein
MCPTLGKVRIAQVLARAGLHLAVTTVGRMLKDSPPADEPGEATQIVEEAEESPATTRVVTAKRPDHVWHIDLSVIPTSAGFWVPWMPFAKPLRWPFCWWIAAVIDHSSRRVCGFALFTEMPTSTAVCAFLDRITKRTGTRPKHIITDKGRQFFCETFRSWCRRRGIRPRFGAVGKHGSIAIIERFLRSMKTECTRQIVVPLRLQEMRMELACYITWYNEHRPHQGLDGQTPSEMYHGSARPAPVARLEPRPRWPLCEPGRGRRTPHIRLVVGLLEGRRHLPVVELQRAA